MVVPPGDARSLAQAIRTLADAPALRAEYGHAGRAFAVAALSRDLVLEDFEAHLRAARKGTAVDNAKAPALEVVRDAERPG